MRLKHFWVLSLLIPFGTKAQSGMSMNPNNAEQFSITINGGITFPFTDVRHASNAPVFGIGGQYAPKPWIMANADLQIGTLKGGDRNDVSSFRMEYKNNFFYGALTARFYPIRLALGKNTEADVRTNLKYLGGIYAGMGIGFISNKVEAHQTDNIANGLIADPDGVELLMPLEVGYNFPITHLCQADAANIYGKSLLSLHVNFRYNMGFSEKLDGYNPSGYENKSKDAFAALTFGVIYNF